MFIEHLLGETLFLLLVIKSVTDRWQKRWWRCQLQVHCPFVCLLCEFMCFVMCLLDCSLTDFVRPCKLGKPFFVVHAVLLSPSLSFAPGFIFIVENVTYVPLFSPLTPSTPHLPSPQAFTPLLFVSMGYAYTFFGFGIFYCLASIYIFNILIFNDFCFMAFGVWNLLLKNFFKENILTLLLFVNAVIYAMSFQ